MWFFKKDNSSKEEEKETVEISEETVEYPEGGYQVGYWIEAQSTTFGYRKNINCILNIECKELGVDTSTFLFSTFGESYTSGEIVEKLEEVLNKSNEELEEVVANVFKKELTNQTDKQKIEGLIKAINNRKGVVFVKK